MKTEKYLTPELKEYYMKDFNENVLTCENQAWKLDPKLSDQLININRGTNVQTLYSKRHDWNAIASFDPKSYLRFAYTKSIELKLFRDILPYFMAKYNWQDDQFGTRVYYEFHYPTIQHRSNVDLQMGCLNNELYNNVNCLKIHLSSLSVEKHEEFWRDLERTLTNL